MERLITLNKVLRTTEPKMGGRHIRFKMTGRRQPNQSNEASKFLEIIILVTSSFPLRRTAMPLPKGPIWNHFLPGAKQNGSHLRAHCQTQMRKEYRMMGNWKVLAMISKVVIHRRLSHTAPANFNNPLE